jgi:hypothetical protein
LSNPLASVVNRRAFLKGGAGLIGGAVLSKTLGSLTEARVEAAAGGQCLAVGSSVSPWGAIAPKLAPETGMNLIQLPPGFSYRSFQLVDLFERLGFREVRRMAFHDSRIPDIARIERSPFLIVEGVK